MNGEKLLSFTLWFPLQLGLVVPSYAQLLSNSLSFWFFCLLLSLMLCSAFSGHSLYHLAISLLINLPLWKLSSQYFMCIFV